MKSFAHKNKWSAKKYAIEILGLEELLYKNYLLPCNDISDQHIFYLIKKLPMDLLLSDVNI